jgi:hypothetical protein
MQIQVSSDNEYFQSGFGNAQYFSELEAAYHNSSIVVPLTYNDPGQEKNFVNGTVRFNSFSFVIVFLTPSSHRVPWIYMGIPEFVPSHLTT